MHFADVTDIGIGAPSIFSSLPHEKTVWCRADTYGEKACAAEFVMYDLKQVTLIAYRPIGKKHHLLHESRINGIGQPKIECRSHFRAAIGIQLTHIIQSPIDIVMAGNNRVGEQCIGLRIELDNIKTI